MYDISLVTVCFEQFKHQGKLIMEIDVGKMEGK